MNNFQKQIKGMTTKAIITKLGKIEKIMTTEKDSAPKRVRSISRKSDCLISELSFRS